MLVVRNHCLAWLASSVGLLLAQFAVAQNIVPTSATTPANSDSKSAEVEKIRRIVVGLGAEAATPARLIQLTRNLAPEVACQAYLLVADDFLREGQVDLAAQILEYQLEHHAKQPAAEQAALQLVQIYSSGELAHTQRSKKNLKGGLSLPPGWQRQQSSNQQPVGNQSHSNHNLLTYASYAANRQLQQLPQLAKDSAFAFQCAATARRGGRSLEAKSWLTLVKHKRDFPQWRKRARAEAWLQDQREGQPPLPTISCPQASKPPRLDGILNEPLWETAGRLNTGDDQAEQESEVRVSFDKKYLYLAGRSKKIENQIYRNDAKPRTYDADLSQHDRLQISLDIDRDYATCYQFTVDHRGWTNDACWLDTSWNPEWFVAAGGAKLWTFEAAIPWSELTPQPPQAGGVWAIAAQRLIPSGKRLLEESNSSGEFNLLLFE